MARNPIICPECTAGDCEGCVRVIRSEDAWRICDCWRTHRPEGDS